MMNIFQVNTLRSQVYRCSSSHVEKNFLHERRDYNDLVLDTIRCAKKFSPLYKYNEIDIICFPIRVSEKIKGSLINNRKMAILSK